MAERRSGAGTAGPRRFFLPSESPPSVRRLYHLLGTAALAASAWVLSSPSLPWPALLLLGLLAFAANTQGLRILGSYIFSLEGAVYLYALLLHGVRPAFLAIFLASTFTIAWDMAIRPETRRLDYAMRKWTNTLVLGLSLLGGWAVLSGILSGATLFEAPVLRVAAGLGGYWLAFTLLNNLLFLPFDLLRFGTRALGSLPRETAFDGAIHALSVLTGAGFALLAHGREAKTAVLLFPAMVVLVAVLHALSEQARRLASQYALLRRMNEFTAGLHANLEMDRVAEAASRACRDFFGADTFFLALLDERSGKVQFATVVDHGETLRLEDADLDRGLTGTVLKTGQPLFIDDLAKEERHFRFLFRAGSQARRIRSILMAPLLDGERCIGVFSVQSDEAGAYHPFHRELFLSFVQQLSAAVVGARLYKRATRDALTRLYNKSYFEEALASALREARPFGLLFLDCDEFKKVNDRLGHPVGDRYLEVLGNALATHCREGDLPCRYGGDEFAVLLPGAGQAETLAVAHRLLDAVDRLVWPGGPEAVPVTVSIGAVWSEGRAPLLPVEDVLRRVDRCLYRAKGARHAVAAEVL